MVKFDKKNIDDIRKRVKDLMPDSMHSTREEMQKTLKSGAEGMLQKLDLVTREEYDVQVNLVKECEQRIEELEKKIDSLLNSK